ncbi:polymorphic toxin type 50 domain-containing protein [Streptococcus sp. ZJ93]|uniref:polymorphic toxin type 50 domain-containing protein n=1 Tax=Streptococcus handemini TaxID=3161188 RepID=UPI0034D70B15
MDKDIVPALLASIQAEFEQSFGKSEVVAAAFETLKVKQATYKTVNELAIEVGDILSQALGASLSADMLPDGKMYYNIAKRLLEDTLGRNFDIVSGYARDVQQLLNEKAGLGLKAQVPALNQDKIDGLVNRLSTADDFESVKWLLGDPIVTFTQGIVDDTIQENVEFHAKVGLSPKITREHVWNCCDWCRGLAGTYDYPKVPKDVYRRHGNCRCVVDYKTGDGKKKNVWSKKWSKESADVLEQRKQLNRDIRDNNRKADNEEFKKIVEVLGAKNAPTSVAKFQDLKYNDVEGYERLKDKVYIQKNFNDGIWLDKINPEKQARHIQSTAGKNKSYFYDDVDFDKLYSQYKQTSKFRRNKGKNELNFELIDLSPSLDIGRDYYTGNAINGFTIHYGKTGAHLVPTYHEGREE